MDVHVSPLCVYVIEYTRSAKGGTCLDANAARSAYHWSWVRSSGISGTKNRGGGFVSIPQYYAEVAYKSCYPASAAT